jgi:hypothetical protein
MTCLPNNIPANRSSKYREIGRPPCSRFDTETVSFSNQVLKTVHCIIVYYNRKIITLEDVEVNQLLWSVLETLRGLSTDGDDVVFDSTLSTWRLVLATTVSVDDTGEKLTSD